MAAMHPTPWLQPFLASLRECGVLATAARAAGVSHATIYRKRKDDPDFAVLVDEALEDSYDALESEARRRALHGIEEPLTHQGQFTYVRDLDAIDEKTGRPFAPALAPVKRDPDGNPVVATIRKPSDSLMQFLLKGYRKRFGTDRTELTGPDGGPVVMDETARAARLAALLDIAQRRQRAAQDDPTGGLA